MKKSTPLPKPTTTALSVRLEIKLNDRLAKVAEQNDRNISQEVRRAIEAHVKKQERMRSMGPATNQQ